MDFSRPPLPPPPTSPLPLATAQPPLTSKAAPGGREARGPWGPAGRGTISLGKGGGRVEIHYRGRSAQRKEFKVFPKADFYQDCQGRSEGMRFQLGGVCFCGSDPRFAGWSQISECLAGFEGQGWPFRCQVDSVYPHHDKAAVFHPPIKLSVTLSMSIIWSNTLLQECSWIELYKLSMWNNQKVP